MRASAFPDIKHPPSGWRVANYIEVPTDQLPRFSQVFGCDVRAISNTVLEKDGALVKINFTLCSDRPCADKVFALFLQAHGGDTRFCMQEGDSLAEFVGKDTAFVLRARHELGFARDVVTYDVDFDAAPLKDGACAEWNDLFRSAVAVRAGVDDLDARKRLEALSRDFTFGSALCLARTSPGGHRIKYVTNPAAADTGSTHPTGCVCLEFADPPRWEGLPSIHVRARITVSAYAAIPMDAQLARRLTGPTRWWPSDNVDVQQIAKGATEGAGSERDKLGKLLDWVKPASHLRFGGEPEGSRYGVAQVLKQEHGRCWDFSDVFISLCRAAGLPARQAGGWLVGQSGHVWAEVFIEGEGWVAVDPTAGAPCDANYVPLWVSDDGMVPFVYLSLPEIRRVTP